jgi:hypothetical protein
MSTERARSAPRSSADASSAAGQGEGGSLIEFSRISRALYERHLVFDKAVDSAHATARERFEAFALTVREVIMKGEADNEG